MIKTAMSFALGCALFLQLPSLPSLYWLCGLLLCIPLFIFKPLRWLALILIGAAWTFVVSYHTLSDWLPAEEAGKVHVLTGVISSVPEQRNQRITFRFNPDKANTDVLSSTIRLNWYRPLPTKITAGERWQLTVKLKQPHGLSNPGGFDYERWLFQQKITATGYVINTPSNKRLSEAPFYSINALRQLIANHIAQRIPNSHYTGLIQGLTTGLKSEISHEQWQVLRGTGISHLLAISGLHIGLMAAIGFWLCKTIWSFRSANLLLIPAHHAGAIGGFILAFIYAALAGFALPTQRALIMLAVLLAAILIKRSLSPSHILATSMLLILIYDPVSILSAGFWLSFSAVAIILFITQGRYPAPKYYWLKIHIVLAFSLSPLLFLFFQKASLIAPIANIIAVPFISLIIVPLVLFATCFLFYFPDISRLLFELADMLIHYFWLVMSWFAHFPFSEISITSLAWYYWIVVIIGITLLISPRGFPVKWLGLIGLLPLLYVKTDRPDTHEFWLTLLDVGQGLSAIIQTQNHTLIFDAGAKFGQDSDSGMSVVLPFLNHQGITHIDTFIVSHGDNDHRGGAQSILDNISVNTLLTSAPEHFLHASHCYSGMAWSWDDVDFELLHPRPSDPLSGNNSSCVLKVSTGDYSLLLTGDIEAQAEQLLIHRYPTQLSSTLLIAPHHGSNTSSTNAFIKAVNPEFVLFPVGFSNRFGFPSKKVVDRYISHKIPTMNTAESGAIQMNVNQDGYSKPTGWRQQHQKVGSYMTNPTE